MDLNSQNIVLINNWKTKQNKTKQNQKQKTKNKNKNKQTNKQTNKKKRKAYLNVNAIFELLGQFTMHKCTYYFSKRC